MSKYEVNVWEYADEFKNLDTNETFYGYQVCKLLEQKDQQISDLEAKLAESEKSKESYRLQNEQHHLQLLQFYSRLGVEAFGADIHEKALETLMIMKEQLAEKEKEIEKLNDCVDFYKSYSVSFQEKIIDELERVKEFCNNPKNRVEYEYCPNAWTYAVDKDKLMLEIDNQIKQLKEY